MDDLTVIPEDQNSPAKVKFRESILALQGEPRPMLEECPLKHYFTPKDVKFGCHAYAREIFLPKGSLVIGKIHKHAHLNFLMKGKVSVNTEFGVKYIEAPSIFVSEVGLKRAVLAVEDSIWCTVHLTENSGEENLDKIENEVIAKTYDELGLIASTEQLQIGESK